ncbi:MAG: endonuclease/exonuclease/phosphatase family protein [Solirubrobacterales bacterium]
MGNSRLDSADGIGRRHDLAGLVGGEELLNRRLLSWNLFHGRDFPPEPKPGEAGLSWKVMGRRVPGREHVLLNRDLFDEFAAFLAAAKWDIALLQEVPPRWDERLARATSSFEFRALTSRNWMSPVMSPVARLRPHLPGSWEGGSNLILVRKDRPGSLVTQRASKTLCWLPERRTMSMVRMADGLCVANFHASTGQAKGERDVMRAAAEAIKWAGDDRPLVLGGDFNIRPGKSEVFQQLHDEYGFSLPTEHGSIDHILLRGGIVERPTSSWSPERRDVPDPESDLMIRLSDHSPVISRISTGDRI